MVDLQTISVFIAAASVTLAAIYYVITFRDSRKTRRIQLFMEFFDKMQTVDFQRLQHDVYSLEWDDPTDFEERYGIDANPEAWAEVSSVWTFINGAGLLVNDGVIDARLIYEWDSYGGILKMWERYKPVIMEMRKESPRFMDNFESLTDELRKQRDLEEAG